MKYAEANIISEIIPTLDAFDMAMANKETWEKADKNWRTGIEYIHAQLTSVLEAHGLIKINPIGEMFDPNNHHAVESIKTTNKDEDHKILNVVACGYSLNGKIIREAQVKVGEF